MHRKSEGRHFPGIRDIREYFAVKATPNPFILKILQEEGCGADCSSLTELMMSRSLWLLRISDIMFSSNVHAGRGVCKGKRTGMRSINLDDITHIDFLEETAQVFRRRSAVVTIRAEYSRSALTSWIIREMPSTV